MEDPLFDPWGDVGDSTPADAPSEGSTSAPRWRPVEGRPTPLTRPAPRAITPVSDTAASSTSSPDLDATEALDVPDSPPGADPGEKPGPRPGELAPRLAGIPPDRLPRRAEPLRDAVLPALRALTQRLELARHDVRIDDRTDRVPRTVRFQLRPWTGPFDDSPVRSAPVLEFVEEESGADLTVRTWLDPSAMEPSTARTIPSEQAARRLGRILLDFVGTALGG